MNDITALMATMKAAAEKAITEEGIAWWDERLLMAEQGPILHEADAKFIAATNPAKVLALVEALEKREELRASANRVVNQQDIELQELRQRNAELIEALEKAQQKVDVYDMVREDYGLCEKGVGLADFVDWQAKRIAELESRNVTVKLPKRSVGEVMHMSGFDRQYAEGWCSGNDNAINEMKLAGIQVIEGER
ncbi:ead/Ea22-like family protein [Kluyvera intermedia]|uniref:ead/Ea22-like family protein n=1 Tax=Kluyvera intermedia TaxID=61648 RepID=UPI00372CE9C4